MYSRQLGITSSWPGIKVSYSGANYPTIWVSLFMEGICATGRAFPRETTRSERGRGQRGPLQLMALQNTSPSTVPVPMAKVPLALNLTRQMTTAGLEVPPLKWWCLAPLRIRVRATKSQFATYGEGGTLSVLALSHLTIDHASLSTRSTVPTPSRDTTNIWALITFFPRLFTM